MKSFMLILTIVLLQENDAQNLWKSPSLNNPGYSLRHQEHNQKIIYGQPEAANPARYVQRTNTIKQSTFVPLKTLYEEEDAGKEKQFNTDLFFTIDELPLHLDTEEFQPEVIVDDLYEGPTNHHAFHHHHPRVHDVVSVEKTHFSLGPGNIKEEKSYFNNKDGQVHALYHTVEATIQGYDNTSLENADGHKSANNTKSEFTEETILINPESEMGILDAPDNESTVEDEDEEESEPAVTEQQNVSEDNTIPTNATET